MLSREGKDIEKRQYRDEEACLSLLYKNKRILHDVGTVFCLFSGYLAFCIFPSCLLFCQHLSINLIVRDLLLITCF